MPMRGHDKGFHVIGYRVSRLSDDRAEVSWVLRMRRKPFHMQHKNHVLHLLELQEYLDARPLDPIEDRRSVVWGDRWLG